MILTSLAVNQLSAEALDWYQRYTGSIASENVEDYMAFFDEDCVFSLNNNFPIYSKMAIRDSYRTYRQAFRSLDHEPLNIHGADVRFAVEMLFHYVRHNGEKLTVGGAIFLERNERGLVQSARLYVDNSEVFKPFRSGRK